MMFSLPHFLQANPAFPEILLLGGTVIILLIDLFLSGKKALTFFLSEVLLLAVLICIVKEWVLPMQAYFSGQYLLDHYALLTKAVMVGLTFLTLAYTRTRDEFEKLRSEYIFLILFALLGAMVLVSAEGLISIYLGLELMSLPVYVLVALKRDSEKGVEAAIKYFVMGALASGFLLFGFSLLYGLTGSLWLPQIAQVLLYGGMGTPAFYVVAIFIIVGIAFKLGIVPFHMWVADVYEGAPLSTVLFVTSVPKIAILALFLRFFGETFTSFGFIVQPIMFTLGFLSLILGSTAALMQKNLRRFLGYSTIANMGIVFLSLGLATPQGFSAAVFYTMVYATTSVALFGLLLAFNREIVNIEDLKGLHGQKPFTAFLFLILLLSFAGVPPLLGFDAKFLVLLSLVHSGHLGVAIGMLVLSVISAGYALRVVKAIYFEKGEGDFTCVRSFGRGCAVLNTLAILGLGIFPGVLITLIHQVFM